jgi:PTH1 family peptidyl-tRNA hydrolase
MAQDTYPGATHPGYENRGAERVKLVVGLGNPGKKYEGTRHNVGYQVLAELARRHATGPVVQKFQGELADVQIASQRVFLLSPLTFMNRSGQSVRAAVDFYKMELDDLIVVCDDLNLSLGQLRFRARGSAGGQKGLADVIQKLGSEQFSRLRLGIGTPPAAWDVADFVLSRFSNQERDEIDVAVQIAVKGIEDWVTHDIQHCMNQYNGAAK